MLRALYTAASGMSAQEMNLDNVANLANSSSAGFRKRRTQFEDLLYQQQRKIQFFEPDLHGLLPRL